MEEDQKTSEHAKRLASRVLPYLTKEEAFPYFSAMAAGEPYIALTWLLQSIESSMRIPDADLLDAFSLLTSNDREEFKPLLHHIQ
ncbi:MAG: hypothetical protein LKJ44_05130 [Bifidobacteriaceae bacterium]|jgi:hypothetical protein|nr:hypothetical protein [Bifidobacteriaceae bacterium]MCI1979080.1 hypothetical protein [Bifidobacteriaceae bacterium]